MHRHILDKPRDARDAKLDRAVKIEKQDMPDASTLELQRRPRTHEPAKRAARFMRIVKQNKNG